MYPPLLYDYCVNIDNYVMPPLSVYKQLYTSRIIKFLGLCTKDNKITVTYAMRSHSHSSEPQGFRWTKKTVSSNDWFKIVKDAKLIIPKCTLACLMDTTINDNIEDPNGIPVVIIDYVDDYTYAVVYNPKCGTMKQMKLVDSRYHNHYSMDYTCYETIYDLLLYRKLETIVTDYLATIYFIFAISKFGGKYGIPPRKEFLMSKPKPVNWKFAPSDDSPELYQMVSDLVQKYHPDLQNAVILIMWRSNWKLDADNYIQLVSISKTNDLYRELREHDFIIGLNKEMWDFLDQAQKEAILDNQLERAVISKDKEGNPKEDDCGRTVYRLRKEHIEGFACIQRRHSLNIPDIQEYAASKLDNSQSSNAAPGSYVANALAGP